MRTTILEIMDRKLLVAFAVSAAIGILLWDNPAVYPFKLLVVLMHESGHAAATLLVSGHVQSISVSPNEGGLTTSLYVPSLLHRVVVSSAGYVGSVISGCVLLFIAARARLARIPLAALAAWTALVALLWVRDPFTLLFTLGMTLVLLACARFLPVLARRALLVFLATFSALYALFDIRDDLLHLGPARGSDADALAKVTLIPAIVWGIGWGLLSLVLIYFTLRAVLRSSAPANVAVIPARQRV
jgi:Peptidase M50B-like